MSNPSGKFFTYQGFRWELHVNSHDTVIVTMAEIVDSERDHVKLFMENPFNLLDKMTYDPAFPMILTLQVGKSKDPSGDSKGSIPTRYSPLAQSFLRVPCFLSFLPSM